MFIEIESADIAAIGGVFLLNILFWHVQNFVLSLLFQMMQSDARLGNAS